MVAMDDWDVDALFDAVRARGAVRRAEPRGLRRRARHALGPLPLRRIRRAAAAADVGSPEERGSPRAKARSASPIINGGTIPDRGLYGVFLIGERGPAPRVGELDEEMVFESRVGETFLLGASTWRIEEITHDRVLVSPAPGEPGKMPFWKADSAGRPLELGRHIGELVRDAAADAAGGRDPAADHASRSRRARRREPAALPRRPGRGHRRRARRPHHRHRAVPRRARRLAHLRAVAVRRPHPRAVGDGGRSSACARRPALDVETMWTDDGFVVRFPETEDAAGPGADAARRRTKSKRSSSGSSAARRSSRRSSARRRRARCSCRAGGPAAARRSGSSASAPPTCSRVAAQLRLVPDAPRGLPRVPARRLRHAGAGRDAAADRSAATSAR